MHFGIRTNVALLVATLLAGQGQAAGVLAELAAGRDARSPQLVGVVGVVAGARGVLRAEAAGLADVATGRALTPDTPLRVASISKLVVAIAVMRLVEQGRLNVDRDISDYLGWRLRNPAFPDRPVTLRQLMSHTSGLVDGPGYSFPLEDGLQARLSADHWAGAPGSRFEYCNLNWGIIGTVMEAATGERFDRLMQRLVLQPLKLDAGYNWQGASDAAIAKAAVLYRKGADEAHWQPDGPWVAQVDDMHGQRPACPVNSRATCDLAAYKPGTNGTMFSPQGGLRISALGLAKIGRLLLNGGKVDGVRLLKPQSVNAMFTPQWRQGNDVPGVTYEGQMLCYGMGPQCLSGQAGASDQPVAGANWWGHLGEAYGLLAGLWVDREHQRVLVYALTGSGADPFKWPHLQSAFSAPEEIIMTDLAKETKQ